MRLPIQRLHPDATLPTRAHPGDAGLDLTAVTGGWIAPRARALVHTGLAVAVPHGHAGLIHPRSGLASKHGVTVLNAPGTIDSGYRGEVNVLLINHGTAPFQIEAGMRIAQLVIVPIALPTVLEHADLTPTDRGDGGFGSTGH